MHISESIFLLCFVVLIRQNILLFWPSFRVKKLFFVRYVEHVYILWPQGRGNKQPETNTFIWIPFSDEENESKRQKAKTSCTFTAENKKMHVKDWQHRWHVMDTACLYPGLLSYIKWSVNTTFLLANGICQHERDVIVGLSFVSAEFSAKSRPPPLLRTFSVSSGKLGRIVWHNEITSAQTNKVKLSRRGALEPDCANYVPGSSAHPQRHRCNERWAQNPSC